MEPRPERLTEYLRKQRGDEQAEVSSVERVPGGFSKETFLVELASGAHGRQSLVVRRDLPAGPTETTVRDEFQVLRALHAQGLPVPEPLWLESDPSWLGQPFAVVRKVEGSSAPGLWGDDAARRAVALELAGLLARLHSLDWASLELGLPAAPRTGAECAELLLDQYYDFWQRRKLEPSPVLVRAFLWLRRERPHDVSRIALVHTDVGPHNLLVHDGRIRALLDWEFAHVGDPAEDLGYARPSIEPLLPWDEFLAAYYSAGGPPYREENARWYEVWRSVRNAVCCSAALHAFVSGANRQVHMALVGIGLYRQLLSEMAARTRE